MSEKKLLRIEYVRLDRVTLWDRNPKEHDIGAIVESIKRYGFRDAVVYDGALNGGAGGIAAGNGRAMALLVMMRDGSEPPDGIDIDASDGMWAMPVQFGIDSASQAAAEAFALDHNNLTMMGGGFSALDVSRMYDEAAYVELLKGLGNAGGGMPVSIDDDDLRLIKKIMASNLPENVEFKEYDESVEDEVEYITCSKCGHKWPK